MSRAHLLRASRHARRHARRILFLDDDPARAEVFLAGNPGAVWVQTVRECLDRLEETWDEVHLDHDLGGEVFVDVGREDCGMEVVRWLCREPRPHLRRTCFTVHSHNSGAACMMVLQLYASGYRVEGRPFGVAEEPPAPPERLRDRPSAFREWLGRLSASLRRRFGRAEAPGTGL